MRKEFKLSSEEMNSFISEYLCEKNGFETWNIVSGLIGNKGEIEYIGVVGAADNAQIDNLDIGALFAAAEYCQGGMGKKLPSEFACSTDASAIYLKITQNDVVEFALEALAKKNNIEKRFTKSEFFVSKEDLYLLAIFDFDEEIKMTDDEMKNLFDSLDNKKETV